MTAKVRETTMYDYHWVTGTFGMMSKEESAGLQTSIHDHGVLEPVVLWVDNSGKEWLVAGRNRESTWRRLCDSGALDPEVSPLPTVVLPEMSEAEMVKFMHRKEYHRRADRPSQRAASAVYFRHLLNKLEPEEAGEESEEKERVTTEMLAEEYGCSGAYITHAKRILRDKEPLLLKVLAGEMTIMDAVALLPPPPPGTRGRPRGSTSAPKTTEPTESHTNGTSNHAAERSAPTASDHDDFPPSTVSHPPEPVKAPEPPVEVLDGKGKPVGDEVRDVFLGRQEFAVVMDQVEKLKDAIVDLCDNPGAAWFKRGKQELMASLKHIKTNLDQRQPHIACRECGGTGKLLKEGAKKSEKCHQCDGTRFLPKDLANTKKKEVAESAAP